MLSSSYEYKRSDYFFPRISEVPVEIDTIGRMKSWIPNWVMNLFD